MATKNLIPEIQLSEEQTERLKERLDEMIIEAEDFRTSSNWDKLHEMFWKQHLCEPKYKVRTSPWPNASNLFVPLTQVADNALVANEFDAMLSNDPTVRVVTTKPWDSPNVAQFVQDSKDLSDYWAWFYREVVNLRTLGCDWLLDNTVDGTSAIKCRINRDTIVRREQHIEERVKAREATAEVAGIEIPAPGPEEVEQRIVEEAFIERVDENANDVSDLSSLYFATGSYVSAAKPGEFAYPHCPWYYQKQELVWEDLLERRRAGYDVPDSLKAQLAEAEIPEKEKVIRKHEGTSQNVPLTITVLEFYMRLPLPAKYQRRIDGEEKKITQDDDEDGFAEEIIVTYAPQARHILRLVPLQRIYPDGKRPHVPMYYHKFPRHIYGQGVPSKLRFLNAAANIFTNQGIDYGSLTVKPWGFYNPGSLGVLPDVIGIQPGTLIPTPDPRGATFPRMQGDPGYWNMWLNLVQSWAERVTSISDPQLGRSPTTPNAPRTARGMIAMLQQGRVAFSILVALHAESFVELCRRNHALKRKYAKEESIFRVLDKATGIYNQRRIPRRAFDIEADFQFVLNPNRQEEHQLNQALFGMFVQALQLAMQAPAVATQIRSALAEVYESAGKKNFNALWPSRLLEVQVQSPAGAQTVPGQAGGAPTGAPGMPMGAFIPPTVTPIDMGLPAPIPKPPPVVTPEEENVAV